MYETVKLHLTLLLLLQRQAALISHPHVNPEIQNQHQLRQLRARRNAFPRRRSQRGEVDRGHQQPRENPHGRRRKPHSRADYEVRLAGWV